MNDARRLGERLRSARRRRGLSLRALAHRIDVSPATLSQLENAKARLTVAMLSKIAHALDVPAESLLSPTASEGPPEPSEQRPRRSDAGVTPRSGVEEYGDWRNYPPLHLELVLGGALREFLELGYHGASVRGIAERCGLSVSSLYHHYPSKQAMLRRILDIAMTELLAHSRDAVAEGQGPVERFHHLVENLVLFHTYRRELGFVGATEMRSFDPVNRAEVTELRNTQQRMVEVEVREGVRQGLFHSRAPKEAARAVVTMCTALSQWYRSEGSLAPEDLAAQYVEFALDLVQYRGDRASVAFHHPR